MHEDKEENIAKKLPLKMQGAEVPWRKKIIICVNFPFWKKSNRSLFLDFLICLICCISVLFFVLICIKIGLHMIFWQKILSLFYFLFIFSIKRKWGRDAALAADYGRSVPTLYPSLGALVLWGPWNVRYYILNIQFQHIFHRYSAWWYDS